MQALSERLNYHVGKDNVSVCLTRFGKRYYVERVGPLGSKLSDVAHDDLGDAAVHFADLVERHP